MLIATYIGERFETETGGYFGTFTDQKTSMGLPWEAVQAALRRGEPVVLVPASAEEIAACEAELAIYKAKASATDVPPMEARH